MPGPFDSTRWGVPPWTVDFRAAPRPLPDEVDLAVVGGGLTGLATAAWLRRLDPSRSVALFEADSVGSGASGHTGGLALAETAAGDLPGLGDVLAGFSAGLRELDVDGGLDLTGVWEISHSEGREDSPICWSDAGLLRAVREVPGGVADAGKLLTGLARAAERLGAAIYEQARVEDIALETPLGLLVCGRPVRARRVLLATNAQSLELSGLAGVAAPKFTLAVATAPLSTGQLDALGLASRRPFYTVDLPYLWGRLLSSGGVIFGGGLLHLSDWRDLAAVDISAAEPARMFARLEQRVRGLHPALAAVEFTHRWGGPMAIGEGWRPILFRQHPRDSRVIYLGGYAGQGVTLSVHLGRWAAEALLGRRSLPAWFQSG